MVLVFGYPALIFLGFLVSCLSLLWLFFGEFTAGTAGGYFLSLFLSFLVSFGFIFWRAGLEICKISNVWFHCDF
jgi:hypothetical protein